MSSPAIDPLLGQFRAQFRGEMIQLGDAAYDTARKVYNGMIDKRPALIVKCVDVADVIAAVHFGRETRMLTAVRGGGHNGGGLGICDGGLVIDLSRMKGVRVDLASRTVRAEGGCVWGDVDHATHAFGMATPCGIISTTGVGGLTLGGGVGYLSRSHGLTIDNLLAVDMVLADGRFVTASAEENPDLFWAVRGGGGNFGVVTSFLFRLHPVKMVHAGPTLWPIEQAAAVMKQYAAFLPKAPENINGFFALLTVPPGPPFPESIHLKKMCGIVWCCTGSAAQVEDALKPMRKFGTSAFDFVGEMPLPAINTMFDGLLPPGLQWYWRGDFVKTLSDDAIAAHVKYGNAMPTPLSTMHLYPIDGAVHRVGKRDTPFVHRDTMWAGVIGGIDPDPANAAKITAWTKECYEATHRFSDAGAAYVNFMMDEGQERIKASYGENYERLASIKKKYDPTNFFRVNQNIHPS